MSVPTLEKTSLVSLQERELISHPDSSKAAFHLVLDLGESGITYEVGDCLGVYPQNDLEIVEHILDCFDVRSSDAIWDKRQETETNFKQYLLTKANLNRFKKSLAAKMNLNQEMKIQDLRRVHVKSLNPQEFSDSLMPLLPRYYSIASSQKVVGNVAHLTLGFVTDPPEVIGVCSRYLCYKTPLNKKCIPIFHHKATSFLLPEESFDKPTIMIGPGTGIAPFIGFLQERVKQAPSQKNWLFFGERHRKQNFYYETCLTSLEKQDQLKLSLAFSRDQEEKIYVQDKMLENSKEFYKWLQEGAYLYVCGDAKHMAKACDQALLTIIENEGNLSSIAAKEMIKNLKQEGRYRRDVY